MGFMCSSGNSPCYTIIIMLYREPAYDILVLITYVQILLINYHDYVSSGAALEV